MRWLKVLIIGGYGTFGGRLLRLLADDAGLEIVVAGRSLEKARRMAAAIDGRAKVSAVALDRRAELERSLASIAADIVVDASGPFQDYSTDPYRVVRAALGAGSSYLDLADDPGFVRGIAAFQDDAERAGLFAVSGVSSCPALTGAVYRRIARDFAEVASVTGGIAPSPYSGVGPSVIEAIAGYAGKATRLQRDGRDAIGYALTETRRYTIGPPAHLPLRSLTFSLVDVPDLTLMATLEPRPASVWFGAAPVPAVYHALFRWLAHGVRRGLLPTLRPLAPLMFFVMNRLSWGEHRGGLFLECTGTDRDGRPLQRSWHLLAEGGTGPMTPTFACVALIRAALAGRGPRPGARAAHLELELEDFEPLFDQLGIACGEREAPPPAGRPLFRRVLGSAFSALPGAIADAHSVAATLRLSGRANVVRGRTLLARLIAAIFRFPVSGEHLPVTVWMHKRGDAEEWTRDFAGRRFTSTLSEGAGAWSGLLCESFGPFRFGIAPVIENERLYFRMRRWSIAGLTMPLALLPKGSTYESAQNDRFHFNVEIAFPILGHIVSYRGWLQREGPPAPSAQATCLPRERSTPTFDNDQRIPQERTLSRERCYVQRAAGSGVGRSIE